MARGSGDPEDGADLLWRVRILDLDDERIVLERPTIAGGTVKLRPGTPLVVVMSIGQNRWMFRSVVIGGPEGESDHGRLHMTMPEVVERCARRSFLRVTTAQLQLPTVECWPLLDPTTVVTAERANRAQVTSGKPSENDHLVLPEVGPKFQARLMNVSGGGVGLLVDPTEAAGLDRARMLWMRVALTPIISEPIGLTARVVHTHIDSSQNRYAGCAFEFAFHPEHREFIVGQISEYVSRLATSAPPQGELREVG
ncbi:MAG: flagellar brake protein [Planctomycetota bacterium]